MTVSIVSAHDYTVATVEAALSRALALLGLDAENPFRELIRPGETVFIKPNWVAHRYRASCAQQHDVFTTITHPSVIRAVAHRVDRALCGRGQITIGDNPSIDADFGQLTRLQDLDDLLDQLKTPTRIVDLRPLVCTDLRHYGKRRRMVVQAGDPRGEVVVDLGKASMLGALRPELFRGVFDERGETVAAHSGGQHLYGFSRAIFDADVYISVPKLKTHHKVGATLNLKGLVGTVGTKNHLVHWREGFPGVGGDAYPGFLQWLDDRFSSVRKRGAWAGNDTIWRMVVDLYEAFAQGPKRRFSVVDGILGGEGDGPFCPEPKSANTLLAGADLLEVDLVAVVLMGFRPEAIPYLRHFLDRQTRVLDDTQVVSDTFDSRHFFDADNKHLGFKAPSGWGHIARG